ncbi:MAG: DUF262 domain-containing protein [Cyanobacteriota bacterium]|jgi:hypothetical protein
MELTLSKEIQEQEDHLFSEDDASESPPSDIVAYNESRSCADLYRMYKEGILDIKPEFQREIVWPSPSQTRFIDSLIKQLPIPSLCFSLDYKTQRWQVIDGLQRMSSIIRFLSGDPNWTLSRLDDVEPSLSGTAASRFLDRESPLYTYRQRVENLTLPITVLRCDYSKKSHTNYLFTIFHRLNTGGVKLNNQEIRNCIYSGSFNDLINELNGRPDWLRLNRMRKDTAYRFRGQELILRFFALYDNVDNYGGRLATFLNEYMADNRSMNAGDLDLKRIIFEDSLNIVFSKIFDSKAPGKLPLSVMEATLVGVAKNLPTLKHEDTNQIKKKFSIMLEDDEFSQEKLNEGLSGKERVKGRIMAAVSSFSIDG